MTGFKSKKAMSEYKLMMPCTLKHLIISNPELRQDEPKYKFSRDWYVADFNDEDYYSVREWCTEQFGPEDKFPNAWSRWQHRYEHQIHFRDKKDYVWFMLKWSN